MRNRPPLRRSDSVDGICLCWSWAAPWRGRRIPDRGDQRSKLQVHGFLTQAYAKAKFLKGGLDTPSQNEVELGIPEDGTTAYRNLALQFRYEMTPQDIVVVQLSNRSLGDSFITELEDEVELDWGFYERRIGSDTSVKVGRVQIPMGIFNEIRDVGTTLPFYRPSFAFYNEGAFTAETLDGVVVSHNFASESDWSLETDFYYGEWDLVESLSAGTTRLFALARTTRLLRPAAVAQHPGIGPAPRLRRPSTARPRAASSCRPGVTSDAIDQWYLSVDGAFDQFTIRGEYREFNPTIVLPFAALDAKLSSYYVQAGYNVHGPFHVWLQYENQVDDTTVGRPHATASSAISAPTSASPSTISSPPTWW